MKLRFWTLVLIGLLALGVLPAVAQDSDDVFASYNCLGLSEADCAIVQAATQNAHDIVSFTQAFTFSASISNASAIAQGFDGAVNAEGSGAFVIDRAKGTDESPYGAISLSMDISGSTTDADDEGEQAGEASFVIADGNLYVQDAATGDWRGAALADLAKNAQVYSFLGMGMDIPLNKLMGMGMMGDNDGVTLPDGLNLNPLDLLETPGFLVQERLADEILEGQDMAVFVYTADIGVLLADADFQDTISGLAAAMGEADDATSQQMAMMLPILLRNTAGTVTLTRWIGADDGLPHRLALAVDTAVDLGIRSGNGTPVPPIAVKLDFAVALTAINATPAPTAPAGATLVAADELLPDAAQ